jgi:2-dehydro-3-deoxy-D-arabinonate dehydratase
MAIDPRSLPPSPALCRVRASDGHPHLALWRDGALRDLNDLGVILEGVVTNLEGGILDVPSGAWLDALMSLPLAQIRPTLAHPDIDYLPSLPLDRVDWLPPVGDYQEVWAAGVTYLRSREARVEEAVSKDIYTLVYEAERPELFFKAAGWRVVPHGGEVGVRSDSSWDVPEPELAVLCNAHGEVVAYACGNDMSSRSIEGENPLYLPQAKVYDASCSIGPAAVLAWHVDPRRSSIHMAIERDGQEVFAGAASITDMVRDPAEMVRVLQGAYTLPHGAWLLTGTSLVPPDYTALPGDGVRIRIDGIGELHNTVKRIVHSGATAPPRAVSH